MKIVLLFFLAISCLLSLIRGSAVDVVQPQPDVAQPDATANEIEGIDVNERQFIETFLVEYETKYLDIVKATDKMSKKLNAIIDSLHFWIPPDVSLRAKTPNSLRAKVEERAQSQVFPTYESILKKMYDIVGVRFTCYFPSIEIPQIIRILELSEGFELVELKPKSNEYLGTNLHARIDGFDMEIQLRGAFHHGFYQINHKFDYKPKEGRAMTEEEQGLLEKVKFHSFEAEIALTELVRLRNVPVPKLKKAGDPVDEGEEWKGLLQHFLQLDADRSGKSASSKSASSTAAAAEVLVAASA